MARRKLYIYGALLAAGAVALLVDRVFFPASSEVAGDDVAQGEPAHSGATPGRSTPARVAGQPGKPPTTSEPASASGSPVVEWLRKLPDVPDARDLFSVGAITGGGAELNVHDGAKVRADPEADFKAAHALQGTYQHDQSAFVLLDGRIMQVGEKVDGFALVRVEPFRAAFRGAGHEAVLDMNTAVGGSGRSAEEKQAP